MSTRVKKVANAEIRAAKKFLERRKIESDEISPKKCATLSKTLDKSFKETLRILATQLSGGQV